MPQIEQNKEPTDNASDFSEAQQVTYTSLSARKWFSGAGSAVGVGLFLAGSAALGGIAMVLWNRRLLTELRRAPEERPRQYTLFDQEDKG